MALAKDKDEEPQTLDNVTDGEQIDLSQLDSKIRQLAAECPPFYKSRNLLRLYLLLACGCLTASVTLGFDTAMMNGLQSVPSWDQCW